MTAAVATEAPVEAVSAPGAVGHVHVCPACLHEKHTVWHSTWADSCECSAPAMLKDCPAHDPDWDVEGEPDPEWSERALSFERFEDPSLGAVCES